MDSVYKLLREKYKGIIQPSGNDYVIRCINPEHEDKNPSMRIDKSSGVFRCVSCGFKGNIFKHYGVLANQVSLKISNLLRKLNEIKSMSLGVVYPKNSVPWNTEFRGIKPKVLSEYGAFKTNSVPELCNRIIFPIKDISGKVRAFVARHTLSEQQPKYRVYPEHAKIVLYPEKIDTSLNYIILVEGIFDMLWLYQNGVHNAVCIFGTNTLDKNTESKMLMYKLQGVTKVYLLLDADKPGVRASKNIKRKLIELNYGAEIIELPKQVNDPAQLTIKQITSLKDVINEKSSHN